MKKLLNEVVNEINIIKQKFIDDITMVSNQCDMPIEVSIVTKDHNNNFYRQGQIHPFDIIIKESLQACITREFVLGSQSVNASQLLAKERESIYV